jgi:hypothetical protein
MAHYSLFERSTDKNFKDRLDKEKGIVRDVKIVGLESPTRRRRYSPEGLKRALKLYENVHVNIDHPESEKVAGRPRLFSERFGKITNPRIVEGIGIVGDMKYNPKHEKATIFEWWVENSPDSVALSHNADGLGKMDEKGWTLIEEITAVRSVDLVADGGTNESLFEGALLERYRERTEMKKIQDVSQTAIGLVHDAMFSGPDESVDDRKKKILEIVDEWSDILQDKVPVPTTTVESKDMEFKDITVEQLKKERPDLIQVVLTESAAGDETRKQKEKITLLERQLDEANVKIAATERATLVQKKLLESKLPDHALTDPFKKQLMNAADDKAVEELIQDRIKLLEGTDGSRSTRKTTSSGGNGKPLSVDDLVACQG